MLLYIKSICYKENSRLYFNYEKHEIAKKQLYIFSVFFVLFVVISFNLNSIT